MEAVQSSSPWCVEKHIIVATHLSQNFIHSTDTDGTLLDTSFLAAVTDVDRWMESGGDKHREV